MDEINEQTYRLYRVVSNEDGECEYVELSSAAPVNIVASIKQVLAEVNAGRSESRVYVVEEAYQEWQE